MEELAKLIDNENVDVAYPEPNRINRYDKVDKKAVQTKIRTNEQLKKIQKELEHKSYEDRLKWIQAGKTTADNLYYENKFDEAMKEYLKALMGLNYDGLTNDQRMYFDKEVKLKILINMGLCAYNIRHYEKTIKFLEQAKLISDEPKIYYVYALVMFKLQNYEEALEMINKAIERAYNNYSESVIDGYKSFQTKISKKLREVRQKEKELYKNIMKAEIYVKL